MAPVTTADALTRSAYHLARARLHAGPDSAASSAARSQFAAQVAECFPRLSRPDDAVEILGGVLGRLGAALATVDLIMNEIHGAQADTLEGVRARIAGALAARERLEAVVQPWACDCMTCATPRGTPSGSD